MLLLISLNCSALPQAFSEEKEYIFEKLHEREAADELFQIRFFKKFEKFCTTFAMEFTSQ